MAEPLTHQPFTALNANNQATRVHPGVVRRHVKDAPLKPSQFRRMTSGTETPPDLKLVSTPREAPLPTEPPAPAEEAEPMAKKKRKTRQNSSEETKKDAVARVQKLVADGTQIKDAVASVAKELGLRVATLSNWDIAHRKTTGQVAVRSGKRRGQLPVTRTPKQQKPQRDSRAVNGAGAEGASIGDLLQAIVTATMEIQRRLSQLTL